MYLLNTPLIAITYLWIPAPFSKKKHMVKSSLQLKLNVSNLEKKMNGIIKVTVLMTFQLSLFITLLQILSMGHKILEK